MLTIQGERKHEEKQEREGYSYSECSHGSFYRAIPLPEGAESIEGDRGLPQRGTRSHGAFAAAPGAEGQAGGGPGGEVAL